MDIRRAYIPKSRKAREIGRLLGLPTKAVSGQYVCNVWSDTDPETARKIYYILDPEQADVAERVAEDLCQQAERYMAETGEYLPKSITRLATIRRGGWALGMGV